LPLDDYRGIVGNAVLDDLRRIAKPLSRRILRNVNSTAVGGGVAEILNRLVPLFRELGIDARWDVIRGGDPFYGVTKKMHNALHGAPVEFTEKDREIYWQTQEENLKTMDLGGDYLLIHDPQPAGLIRRKDGARQRWVWRCHVDVSAPNPAVWGFLKTLVEKYDASVFSAPAFAQDLSIRQMLVAPSIDPLSDKNKDLAPEFIRSVLDRFQISQDKPIVTQVSRFDYLKDPLGVIDVYRRVKPHIDCQLLLVGGSAADDPEGAQVLSEVRNRAEGDPDIHVLELPPHQPP